MGWKGESRRHSLARKGVKTNVDQVRRFDVSTFVAKGETHRIKYEYEYKGDKYNVVVEKDKDVRLTLYLGEYIFLSQLKAEHPLKAFFVREGRLTDYEKGKLEKIKLIRIEKVTPEEEVFKEDVIFKQLR